MNGKTYLSAGQASALFHVKNAIGSAWAGTVRDLRFGLENSRYYRNSVTFGGFIRSNDIIIIEPAMIGGDAA